MMDINKIRQQYIADCINNTLISEELLENFTRYLYSKEFPQDLQKIDNSSKTTEEKQQAFNDLILKKGIPLRYQN